MAGLPKKYAKMGFKKGWAVYKKTKSKTKKSYTVTTRKVRKVAKKKRSYKKATKKVQSFGNTFLGKLTKKAIPIAYGFSRDKVSDFIANSELGKKLPVFDLIDEATMLGINAIATKMGARKNPIARRALQAMEDIELSNVGEELSDMFAKKKGGNNNIF